MDQLLGTTLSRDIHKLIGLPSFNLEVDAKYIKGMINNPDIQPNNAMNRWIAAILLFPFKLVHVPGKDHAGPDGLSRRRAVEGDIVEEDTWVDDVLGLGIWTDSWLSASVTHHTTSQTNTAVSFSFSMLNNDSEVDTTISYSPTPLSFNLTSTANFSSDISSYSSSQNSSSLNSNPPSLNSHFSHSHSLHSYTATPINSNDLTLPRTKEDIRIDTLLPLIYDFLKTTKKPDDMDETETKRFIKYATRFFVRCEKLWRRRTSDKHQLVILDLFKRLDLIKQAHDQLGHKQAFSTRRNLSDRFWWPGMDRSIAWYVKTCHECQLFSSKRIFIPPTVPEPAPLFRRVHLDTAHMQKAAGFQYLVQARCSLTGYAEYAMLRNENAESIGRFIFKDLICRWGAIEEIVTDNGTPIVAALKWISNKYHINHIRISPYNKQANGIVERGHLTVRRAIIKTCGTNLSRWPEVTPYAIWADRVTVRKHIGYSPFYMVHGIDPILPFDVTEATFLVPKVDKPLKTEDLISLRARQLEKRPEDLEMIKQRVLKARYESIAQFEKENANLIVDYDFKPGSLVLVRNSALDTDLNRKSKPRFIGPYVVVKKTRNTAYILAELDGAVHKTPFAGFRVIPYHPRSRTIIPITFVKNSSS